MSVVLRHALVRNNVITRPEAVIGQWTTTQLAQSTTVRATAGAVYRCFWGDGTIDSYVGNGADQVCAHNYGAAGTYIQKWVIADATKLLFVNYNSNLLVGLIPTFLNKSALIQWYCSVNSLTGLIPSLSNNQALIRLRCDSNKLTGYTASALATTIITFRVDTNLLPQSAIDQILADFATNVAARPAVVTLNLGGVGNAAPSAAGLASKAAILAAKPGWIITNN